MIDCYIGERWVGELPISEPVGDWVKFKGPDIDNQKYAIILAHKRQNIKVKRGHVQKRAVLCFDSKKDFDYVFEQYD